MFRTASVTAYDLLDKIVVTVEIRQWEHTGIRPENYIEFSCAATVDSTGEDEPHEWLQQALLALLESC